MNTQQNIKLSHEQAAFNLFMNESEILHHWQAIDKTFKRTEQLEANLLERVKQAVEHPEANNFSSLGNPSIINNEHKRLSLAKGFALMYALNPETVKPAHFRLLNEVFSKTEIAALCAYICYVYASVQFCQLIQKRQV
ncbi:MAG TPA: hypothetical protein PKC24_09385 [Cyclobacteriaceae bacterium]|nr:hypothetical protein [Cyclobacteriaceae bacterium]